jgi:hypothetical protein
LQGSRVPPRSARERDVARLLELIEEAYPDAEFPRVRWSLQAIHAAQMASLRQQSPAHPLPGLELLRLSVEKGGASVLADGCLVGGQLDPAEADFVFGYGVVLQLLDDLQDVRPDLDAGHETIFTRAAARGALDEPADRLRDFMRRFFASSAVWTRQGTAALRELIASSCGFLIRNAVALNPSFFTPEYSARIERGSRFSFAFVRERRTRLLGACGKLRHSFERRQGLDGLLELLG